MRKKTIKFYFFNNFLKNPAMSYLFCFSKRAFRQNKRLNFLKKKNIIVSNKKILQDRATTKQYKTIIFSKININQWQINHPKLQYFFINSFFFNFKFYKSRRFKSPTMQKKLALWFTLKFRTYNYFYKKLQQYTQTGVLSSHFVHILSRKNLSYQSWSKYRAKLFNMNKYMNYIKYFTSYTTLYNWILVNTLYSFTNVVNERTYYQDTEFNLHKSESTNYNQPAVDLFKKSILKYNASNGNVNTNANLDDLNTIYNNIEVIESYCLELDTNKKDLLYKILLEKNVNIKLMYSRYFILNTNITVDFTCKHVIFYYIYLYNLWGKLLKI